MELARTGANLRPIDRVRYRASGDDRWRVFVQTAAIAYPARVAQRYDELRARSWFRALARPFGTQIYKLLALAGMRREIVRERRGQAHRVRLEFADGETIEETAMALFIGNERSLGGDFVPCPEAQVDDGQLDFCMVRAGTGASYLRLFQKVSRGEHLGDDSISLPAESRAGRAARRRRCPLSRRWQNLWVEGQRFEIEIDQRAVPPRRWRLARCLRAVDGGRDMKIVNVNSIDPVCPHCEREMDRILRVAPETKFLQPVLGYCYLCPHCRKVLGFADFHS